MKIRVASEGVWYYENNADNGKYAWSLIALKRDSLELIRGIINLFDNS